MPFVSFLEAVAAAPPPPVDEAAAAPLAFAPPCDDEDEDEEEEELLLLCPLRHITRKPPYKACFPWLSVLSSKECVGPRNQTKQSASIDSLLRRYVSPEPLAVHSTMIRVPYVVVCSLNSTLPGFLCLNFFLLLEGTTQRGHTRARKRASADNHE